MICVAENRLEKSVYQLPIDKILPNPNQPRKVFDKFALDELSKSIEQFGIMQPISVRIINHSTYELVAGERRLRASKQLGLSTIPAIIVDINDSDSAVIALLENLQRQDLNFLEEAEGYAHLIQDYGLTQEQLAIKLGKNQSTIANKLRILRLSRECKKLILDNTLTERHARALIKLPDEEGRLYILESIIGNELTVKQTELLIEEYLDKLTNNNTNISNIRRQKNKKHKIKMIVKDIRIFTNTINQAVDVMKSSGFNVNYTSTETSEGTEIKILIPR